MSLSAAQEHGKVVIITGGTSGIGLDLAEHLHSRGYRITISGRHADKGQAVASDLDPTGETVLFVQGDVVSYEDQVKLFRESWDRWQRLDVFIANAGIVDVGSRYNLAHKTAAKHVHDVPPKPDLSGTDVLFKGVIYGTELAVHYMRHNPPSTLKGGKIIVTGSVIGLYSFPVFPEGASAKAASLHWVWSMAPMLRHENITINTVLPNGYVTGAMSDSRAAYLDEHLTTKECLLNAYNLFLNDRDNERTGQAVEAAHDQHYFHDEPDYKSGSVIRRTVTPYEPWFIRMHGAPSGLKHSIKGPLRVEKK